MICYKIKLSCSEINTIIDATLSPNQHNCFCAFHTSWGGVYRLGGVVCLLNLSLCRLNTYFTLVGKLLVFNAINLTEWARTLANDTVLAFGPTNCELVVGSLAEAYFAAMHWRDRHLGNRDNWLNSLLPKLFLDLLGHMPFLPTLFYRWAKLALCIIGFLFDLTICLPFMMTISKVYLALFVSSYSPFTIAAFASYWLLWLPCKISLNRNLITFY